MVSFAWTCEKVDRRSRSRQRGPGIESGKLPHGIRVRDGRLADWFAPIEACHAGHIAAVSLLSADTARSDATR